MTVKSLEFPIAACIFLVLGEITRCRGRAKEKESKISKANKIERKEREK